MSPVLSWVRVGSATSTASGSLVVVGMGTSDSVESSEPSETGTTIPLRCLPSLFRHYKI